MMKLFDYEALDEQGKRQKGTLEATDSIDAGKILQKRGWYLLYLKQRFNFISPKIARQKTLKPATLANFCYQLSILLASGLSLQESLPLLRTDDAGLQNRLVMEVLLKMENGLNFSKALADSSIVLPPLFIELVAVGEQIGQQSESMAQASLYFQNEAKFKQTLLAALLYPMLVFIVMVIAITAMLFIVVPSLVQTYQNLQAPMPLVTQIVVACGLFLRRYGLPLSFIISLTVILFIIGRRFLPDWQRFQPQRLFYALPVVRKLLQEHFYSRFARSLSQLLDCGVALEAGLALLVHNEPSALWAHEIAILRYDVLRGQSLSQAAENCSFIPADGRQMILIGEKSGNLAAMLLRSSDFHWHIFEERTLWLTKLAEPVLIVVLGLFILLIAASLFLPIITSYQYIA